MLYKPYDKLSQVQKDLYGSKDNYDREQREFWTVIIISVCSLIISITKLIFG